MRCEPQLKEIKEQVLNLFNDSKEYLFNKNFEDAVRIAESINNQYFYGEKLVRIKKDTTSPGSVISDIYFDSKVLDSVIDIKYEQDNLSYEEQLIAQRINELKEGNNYDIDLLPQQNSPIYDEFNYENVISNKYLLKENLERRRNLLLNKKSTKAEQQQIQELNEIIRKLFIDISNLEKTEESLDNYLKSVDKDISNIETMLNNPTIENLDAVRNYLDVLDLMTEKSSGGFLNESMTEIDSRIEELKNNDPNSKEIKELKDISEKLKGIVSKVAVLRKDYDNKSLETIKDLISFHLKQKEEYKNWDEQQIKEEAERLYENQINPKLGNKNFVNKYFLMLDNQEEKNVLVSTLYKVVSDAVATNNNKEKRKQLSDIKDAVFKELKKLGKVKGVGLFKKVDQSIFLRKSDSSNQLIGKFSENWVTYKKTAKATQDKISKILYKPDKTENEQKQIKEQFDNLNENTTFIDVTRIPEIINDSEFSDYSASFLDKQQAEDYKKELISKIGNREYNKIVQQQKENIYAYESFKMVREARLRDKYNLSEGQDLQDNISEKDWNSHLHFLYSKSPFIFSENYRMKGNNIITKPYYVKGQKFLSENTPADLEFISYVPKQDKFFDSDFKQIEENPILNEAWGYMADLVEYNNKNGFNQNPDNLTEYSLSSQQKRVKYFPMRFLGILSKNTLNTIHEAVTTTRFKDRNKEYNISGQITNDDQEIDRLYKARIKKLNNPTQSELDSERQIAKEIVMSKKDEDLIDNILASTELTEAFKAKREVENKVKFIKRFVDKAENREEFKDLVDFFISKKFYGIDNRANWLQESNFSDHKNLKWSRFYNENEKEIRKELKEATKSLKEELKNPNLKDSEKQKIEKDLSSIKQYLDSGGKVVTTGSLLESVFIKLARVGAFSLNFAAQTTNLVVASVNAREVDGRKGFWKPGVYHDALSFSRKWKAFAGNENTKKEIKTGELLLQRLQIFQNSANEIFKIEKSRTSNAFFSVLENPMNFVSEVEKTIQRPQIFALLSEVKIKDKNGNEVAIFDSKTRSFPAFHSDNGELELKENFNTKENKETFLENTSQEYANLFGDSGKIPEAIAYINGDYRDTSTYLFEKEFVPSMLMLFKRWAVKTVRKKSDVVKNLGENEHAGLGTMALGMKGATYAFATEVGFGSLLGPMGMAGVFGAYMATKGFKAVRREMNQDSKTALEAAKALLAAKSLPKLPGFTQSIKLAMAVSAQSLGMIVDPFTRTQLVNSDHIKRIMEVKEFKKNGEKFTQEEINQIKDDLYFLTTSIANTIKFLAYRYLVMAALYPDEEEEKNHKERVKEGKTFWERLYADPDTSMYFILENMLSSFVDDSNLLVNYGGIERMGDMQYLQKIKTHMVDLKDWINGEGDFKKGKNQGSNKFLTHFMQYYTPSALKDGVSLGFGSRSKKDFNTKNYIDQVKVPILEKINKKRLDARKSEKKKLMESDRYNHLSEDKKIKKINKDLLKKYPVIKKNHLTEDGKLKPHLSHKWEHYWDK